MIILLRLKYYVKHSIFNRDDVPVPLAEGATIKDLKLELAKMFPQLFPDAAFAKYVVSGCIADDRTQLTNGCTVVIMTPMAGG